jgi:flagellin-like protein
MKHLAGVLERVKTPIGTLAKGQRGVTGLETAIILIAFVVVASVFAFTVLSTGIFSSEKGKETIHAGLKEARSSIEVRGAVVGYGVADIELSDADTAWTALTNTTATRDNLDKKEGTHSAEILVGGSFSTGLAAYENVTGFLDLSAHDSIELWVKSSIATTAGQIEIGFDQTDNCSSFEETIDIPALAASTWKLVQVGISAGTSRDSVDCIGLNVASDLGASQVTINLDLIVARGQLNTLVITLANAIGGEAVDISPPADSDNDGVSDTDIPHKLIIQYQDATQRINDIYWTRSFIGTTDGDNLLEVNEKVDITISLRGLAQATPLVKNTPFEVELRPREGGVLLISRTTPANITAVTNLN